MKRRVATSVALAEAKSLNSRLRAHDGIELVTTVSSSTAHWRIHHAARQSVSLAVKDIAASRAFYEKLGFTVWGGDQAQHWLILKNDSTVIGLFQGMFERNFLTFNPGWDGDANTLPEFTDVRALQRELKAKGIAFLNETDETTSGPASFVVEDPDGNQILIDQHV